MMKKRLFTFDFLRLSAMIAIIHFHTHEFFFYSDTHVLKGKSFFNTFLEPYSRFMSFSGFTIIILSFFLFGYNKVSPQKWKRLLVICSFGIMVLLLNSYDGHFYVEWDIYYYVIASLLLIRVIKENKKIMYSLAVVFLFLLLLPSKTFLHFNFDLGLLQNPLFGDYKRRGAGSWPLIPWFGLALVFYALGVYLSKDNRFKRISQINKTEFVVWLVLLISTLPMLGAYYEVPIGPNFYKFVFNRGTLAFWSHILWIIFIMRLSFADSLNNYFNQNKYFNWISRLQLNQSFFLFYIVQLAVIGFFANFSEIFYDYPWLIDIYLLAFIPAVEVLCTYLIKLKVRILGKKFL